MRDNTGIRSVSKSVPSIHYLAEKCAIVSLFYFLYIIYLCATHGIIKNFY